MSLELPYPILERCDSTGVPLLTDDALFDAVGVRMAFTGREGGVSTGVYSSLNTASDVGDDLGVVKRNRRRALEAMDIDEELLIVPNQVHGLEVLDVRCGFNVERVSAQAAGGIDAIVVEPVRVAALMSFADCLSLILVSPSGRFAIAHAGWRGAVAGIAGKTARALVAADGGDATTGVEAARRYNAYVGPHIRAECFEVGDEVVVQFIEAYGEEAVSSPNHIDLARAVTIDLLRAGLCEERIVDSRVCTKCNPDRFFSYRASGGQCGRHAAIACRMR